MIRHVVLVDNDPDEHELLLEPLKEIDHSVKLSWYSDARNFLLSIRKDAGTLPDVIILDINMPTMDGWECLSILKDSPRTHLIPVVMYSTSGSQTEITKSLKQGAHGYCRKSVRDQDTSYFLKTLFNFISEGVKGFSIKDGTVSTLN